MNRNGNSGLANLFSTIYEAAVAQGSADIGWKRIESTKDKFSTLLNR